MTILRSWPVMGYEGNGQEKFKGRLHGWGGPGGRMLGVIGIHMV